MSCGRRGGEGGTISLVFQSASPLLDVGEYWCESDDQVCSTKQNSVTGESHLLWSNTSKTLQIEEIEVQIDTHIVTDKTEIHSGCVPDGHVILESPVLPVMEGRHVTLGCRTRTPTLPVSTDFYKDGFLIRTEPTPRMTILNVSKSDEGLYKCSVSGLGYSPESWLAVSVFKTGPR